MDYPSLQRRLPPKRVFVEFVAEAMEKAANCNKCGECEERCPYGLPIREIIEGYVAEFKAGKSRYLQSNPSAE